MAGVPNYLEVARWLQGRLPDLTAGESSTKWEELLEFAAEELGVQRDELVHSRKRSKIALPGEAVSSEGNVREAQSCRHSCCEHTEPMDPNRWGALPHELLQLVFANLPVNRILDLQYLTKDWTETMGASGHSDLLRACDEAHPKMFALIRKLNEPGNMFLVRVFDTKSKTWLALRTCSGLPAAGRGVASPPVGVRCEDGGLVLISFRSDGLSRGEEYYCFLFCCTVMNPLTRYVRHLPPIPNVQNVLIEDMMVHRATNCYKVLVVVYRGGTATEDTLVYDSETGEWSQPSEATDVMFGNQSAHDFAKGRLIGRHFNVSSVSDKEGVESHSFLKNRLFVLLKDTDGPASEIVRTSHRRATYYIREYVVVYHPQHLPTWLEVDTHRCVPFEFPPRSDYRMVLLSANGFLMVFATLIDFEPWQSDRGWLYELSTRNWRDLPELPGNMHVWLNSDFPCEIRWNAHP